MADTGYKPVPHDAAFRKALLAKPGVKKAFDALDEEYTTLHTMLDARQTAGLTQADVSILCHFAQIRAGLRKEACHPDGVICYVFDSF
jgi:hypothetical protein